MAVDGGAGNTISFSEIQTYYGGSNPISISEYYRGGSEVPGTSTLVSAQSNTSGTSSQTIGEFSATVTEVDGSLTTSTPSTTNLIVQSTHSFITFAVTGQGDAVFSYYPGGTGNGIQLQSAPVGGDGEPHIRLYTFRCPQFNSGDATPSDNNTYSAGDRVIASGTGSAAGQPSSSSQGFRAIEFDVSFTNNNANTITTTSGSTGGAQTYTQNQTRQVKNNSSSNSYTLGYDEVTSTGNTNVPASGTINIDVFNAPGSATP